jgi:hypothetical protein
VKKILTTIPVVDHDTSPYKYFLIKFLVGSGRVGEIGVVQESKKEKI